MIKTHKIKRISVKEDGGVFAAEAECSRIWVEKWSECWESVDCKACLRKRVDVDSIVFDANDRTVWSANGWSFKHEEALLMTWEDARKVASEKDALWGSTGYIFASKPEFIRRDGCELLDAMDWAPDA